MDSVVTREDCMDTVELGVLTQGQPFSTETQPIQTTDQLPIVCMLSRLHPN